MAKVVVVVLMMLLFYWAVGSLAAELAHAGPLPFPPCGAVQIDPDQLEIDGFQAAVDKFGSVNTRFAGRQQQLYNNLTVLFDPEAALTSVSSKISIHRCRACPICAPVENGGPPPHTA